MTEARSSGFENINGAGSGAVGFFRVSISANLSVFPFFFFETRFFEEEKDRLNSF